MTHTTNWNDIDCPYAKLKHHVKKLCPICNPNYNKDQQQKSNQQEAS